MDGNRKIEYKPVISAADTMRIYDALDAKNWSWFAVGLFCYIFFAIQLRGFHRTFIRVILVIHSWIILRFMCVYALSWLFFSSSRAPTPPPTSCWRMSPYYTHLTYRYFIIHHRQSRKQVENNVHSPLFVRLSHSELRSALFLAQLSTHASPCLYLILTSFVRTSPITMLTNRPCHGPWRGLGDSAL